jgi:hypothetical protein
MIDPKNQAEPEKNLVINNLMASCKENSNRIPF